MAAAPGGRELPDTPTWAVALVVLVLVLISVAMEHALHKLTHWFHKRHKKALAEALEKMKAELMLVGFLSLLLTVFQDPISKICISKKAGSVMLPCKIAAPYAGSGDSGEKDNRRRLLSWVQGETHRRFLAGAPVADVCAKEGKVALMSAGSMHQLHIFIFVLAVFHVFYSVVTMALSRLKMRKWKKWEAETASLEYQFANDPSRFRFTHQTSFVKRHMGLSSVTGVRWVVAFFRQFFRSVTKVDYLTLRMGFINITPRRRYQAKNHSASRAEASTKKIVHIKDLSGNQLAVNLWGQAANDFDSAGVMELGKTEPIIVIFVGTLVKTYDGHRGVSGSAACRWYINENLPDTNSFRRGLQGQVPVIEHLHLRGQTPAEVAAQVNLEEKTVKELLSLDLFDHRDMRFYCTATLARLSPGQSWWFPSCTTCHKSAIQNAAAYKCSDPKCIGTDALPRYKICFIAADGEAEAEFVFFDRVGRDLLGMPLITLLRHGHPSGIQLEEIVRFARQDDSTPKELDAIVSRKFRFVVSISNKCYLSDNDDLTFQVHRVDAPLDKQTQTSVFYRASSSSSTFGPGSSSSELALADDQHTGTLAESTSPDLLAHDALSPEDRAAIPLQTTPPSVTKTNTSSTTSTALAANPIRRNLFPPKGIDSVQVGEKASVSAKEKPPVPDKDSGSKRPALPEAEGDFTTPGKKKKK